MTQIGEEAVTFTVIEAMLWGVTILGIVVGLVVLPRRQTSPLALPLALVQLGGAAWAGGRALALLLPPDSVPAPVNYASLPGVGVAVGASLWYFLVLAGHGPLNRRAGLLVCLHPLFLLVVVPTDPWHHLFLRAVPGDAGALVLQGGPLYQVNVVYCTLALLAGLVLSTAAMFRAVRGHRQVYAWSLVAAAIPLLGNNITQLVDFGHNSLDVTPILFSLSGAIWLSVERSGRQTGLVPISSGQVLAALADAVLVVDPEGRLLDANPAARALLHREGRPTPRLIGAHWHDVVRPEMRPAFEGGDTTTLTIRSGIVLEVRATKIVADGGPALGSVVVVRDVTELDRLRRELAEQAVRDGLTGLHNRRHLERVLEAAAGRTRDGGPPISAVMLDIDHFKRVNDRYGHAVGDQVLIRVAAELTRGVRAEDTVARFGGEEFVLLLHGVSADAAADRAELLRARCARLRVPTGDGPVGITISAGIAQWPDGGGPDELLRLADGALYEAKAAGRDVVVRAAG
ncbi:histidine kinase N-terminal 7TM domain-containing diguanylate cyclase [Pengzhenrongella frigida]|uniref:Diguanylate cyclase n=1 Tax=Pengzhenrongella frigida TaxID=1259133 RepID=A0A4Q5N014_9MICO|nr:diguanylate cyclase [Cellulomonas sp. HLT2-17]RYV49817.1 diguanylate cyclase [Cellulomonas sp. HLT2-17]